jgi:hypothetical protein
MIKDQAPLTIFDILNRLNAALEDFKEEDLILLTLTADERAATHRIAIHIEKEFPGWNVDCEYNRKRHGVKELPGIGAVRPDIIVHHRDTEDNLLVIEVKKKGKEIQKDRLKLIEFTKSDGEFCYKFGMLLILNMKRPFFADIEIYQNGDNLKGFDNIQVNLDMTIQ